MKRRLLIIAIFLLLGAVANVAVAWACALWSSPTKVSIRGAIHDRGGFGYTERGILMRMGGTLIQITPGFIEEFPPRDSYRGAIMPSQAMAGWPRRCFIRDNTPPPPPPGRILVITLDEPLPLFAAPPVLAASAGIELPSTLLSFKVKPNRRIPTQILWSGFAQNVLVFAVILGLGIRGLSALRRFLRLRRGLCPKCAYPMGESAVCSECGNAVPKRAMA